MLTHAGSLAVQARREIVPKKERLASSAHVCGNHFVMFVYGIQCLSLNTSLAKEIQM